MQTIINFINKKNGIKHNREVSNQTNSFFSRRIKFSDADNFRKQNIFLTCKHFQTYTISRRANSPNTNNIQTFGIFQRAGSSKASFFTHVDFVN